MNSEESNDIMAELDGIYRRLQHLAPEQHNQQTIIHRTEGPTWVMGLVLGFAVATCLATWIGMILFYDDIRDLKAWTQVNNNAISELRGKVK